MTMSTTMNVLYPVSLDKLKNHNQEQGHENNSPSQENKKIKLNSMTSHSSESKSVLSQISMNQQQQPQKQRKRRVSDGSTKVKPPPGVAVARRNARERNRVKQVNNGFSLLRDHIPIEIAETYDQASRGSAKKLSKVETLKMAVEYIRSLEKLLSFDSSDSMPSSPSNTTFGNLSETSLPATPPPESQQPFFYALKPHGNLLETEITIVNGQQYIRIPGTNTFQLVTPDFFENEENVHPNPSEFTTIQIHPPSSTPHNNNNNSSLMIQPTNGLMSGVQTPSLNSFVSEINSSTSVINSSETPAGSISPYSGHSSLSPAPSHHTDNISSNGNNIMMEDAQFSIAKRAKEEFKSFAVAAEHLMIHNDTSHYDNLILKQEIINDDSMFVDESSLSNENMMEAIKWWEHQQSLEHSTTP